MMYKSLIKLAILFFFILVASTNAQPKDLQYSIVIGDTLGIPQVHLWLKNQPGIKIYSSFDLTFPDSKNYSDTIYTIKNRNLYEYRIPIRYILKIKNISLKVTSEGYNILSVDVNDLKPNRVNQYNVSLKTIRGIGDFCLSSEPAGAKVTVYGYPALNGQTPFRFLGQLAMPYNISLEKNDYYKVDTTINIIENKKDSILVKLRAKFGILKLKTDSANTLFIDNVSHILKDTIHIPEGEHTISVKRKYYKDSIEIIKVIGQYDPEIFEINVKLKPYNEKPNLISSPRGAAVYLIDHDTYKSPVKQVVYDSEYIKSISFNKSKDIYSLILDINGDKKDMTNIINK